ncbi:MAG: purine-binding chemotaxis protein CheW [Bacteriovoracaceae bacterium]|nr:purine-binding chemotaxis protein CheW [Bacteriovoracaceae bacterium]
MTEENKIQNDEIQNAEGGVGVIRAKEGKYLTFQLDTEVYGLDILMVQEIIGLIPITRVPKMPDFLRGVINLRGKIIPIIDLRVKFRLDAKEDTEKTCIIVVQIEVDGKQLTMGAIVDEVAEVIDIRQNQIEFPPSLQVNAALDFIMGMGKIGEKVIMLLDIEQVFGEEDIQSAFEQCAQ